MQLFYAIFNVYRSQVDPKAKVRCAALRCATLRHAASRCVVGHGAVRLACLGASPGRANPVCAGARRSVNLQFGDALFIFAALIIVANIIRCGAPVVAVALACWFAASAIHQQHMFRCLQLLHASPVLLFLPSPPASCPCPSAAAASLCSRFACSESLPAPPKCTMRCGQACQRSRSPRPGRARAQRTLRYTVCMCHCVYSREHCE